MRIQALCPTYRWTRITVLALPILIGSAGLANGQEPTDKIFSLARTAAQNRQLNKSEQLGFSIIKSAYSDIPADGGILIGFDLQLSKVLSNEIVQAIKPLYATAAGDIATKEFGVFGSKSGKKKDADLTRAVRIRAPEGYAVGSITVRHGLYIDGLKLTFQRIKGNALDTNDTAGSDWIGNSKGGHLEKTIGGNGAPIVGIFGNKDDRRVLALGVYQLPAPVIAWPRPVAKPQEDRPVIENRQAEPEKIAAPAEKTPTDEVPIERAGGVVNPGVPNKEPKAVPKAEGQDQPVGLLFGIFACLSVALVIGCWLAFAGKTVRPSYPFSEPGGAVSIKAAAPAPATMRVDDAPAAVPAISKAPPPYFHARAVYSLKRNRFYRVYVLPEMLLFLDAGPETNDQYKNGIGAAGAFTGGLLGAVLGSAIGSVIDSTRGDSRAQRKYLLDTADTAELIQLAEDAGGGVSFRALPADFRDARIEPTSLWHSMQFIGNKYVGLLCLDHIDRGKMTLEIPAASDMKIALAELPAALGDQLAVNVVLDRQSWQYVGKSS